MTEKRFQVFISSTFRDLIAERQAVLKAVLEINHMPAGMELFPATDDSAWQLIKDVIDSSDYYVLLIGGRYGSLDEEGIGFTEKEYDYARQTKKCIIALLHSNPDNLPRDKTETVAEAWTKLQAFREKVLTRHTVKMWSSVEELTSQVILGLTTNIKRHPAVGWIRADAIPSDATIKDILSLKQRVIELEAELEDVRTGAPAGTDELAQGDDIFEFEYKFDAVPGDGSYFQRKEHSSTILTTWNEIFSNVAPLLINEECERNLRKGLSSHYETIAREFLRNDKKFATSSIVNVTMNNSDISTCLVQLRALGLIRESSRRKSISDKDTYWSLTPYGDHKMVQLRAVRRGGDDGVEIIDIGDEK